MHAEGGYARRALLVGQHRHPHAGRPVQADEGVVEAVLPGQFPRPVVIDVSPERRLARRRLTAWPTGPQLAVQSPGEGAWTAASSPPPLGRSAPAEARSGSPEQQCFAST
jgi:hypothetical protein